MVSDPSLPSPRHRRTALGQLSRERLVEIADRHDLEVGDRRAVASLVDAVVRSKKVDFADVLRALKREELQAICGALAMDSSGREKEVLVGRILSVAAKENGNGDSEPAPAAASPTVGTFALSSPTLKPKATRRAPSSPRSTGGGVLDYRHDDTRKNNPPAGLIEFDRPPPRPTQKYSYDPHLDPTLQWAGKAERPSFEVDTVSLHIHERVSTQAILRAVKREEAQRSLFADIELTESKAIDFYQHDVGWSNRLILGDSLLVMNSLLEREQMAGKVQCVYVDPPYGVKFNSNFQPSISRRDVKDGDDGSLTREPEQIQAYRDTWTLGVHSYLSYMRDRLLLGRELLAESGSIFVQISDENLHYVRNILDEIFGADNFVSIISFKTTGGQSKSLLASDGDYLLWYARSRKDVKFRQLYRRREAGDQGAERYVRALSPDGKESRRLTPEEIDGAVLPAGWRRYRLTSLTSQGFRENTSVPWTWDGEVFDPGRNLNWKATLEGRERLAAAGRIEREGRMPAYRRFLDDFPAVKLTGTWTDTQTNFGGDKMYVVRTAEKVVARCIVMTTDPGDLVFDPTCGSGTTAFVAEQWGRRWITCDTSRVALALARQRLLTSRYPYYHLRSSRVRDGFVYRTVPHIISESIANNPRLDECATREARERVILQGAERETLYDDPEEDKGRVRVSGPFTVEAIPVASMEDESASPIAPLADEARAGESSSGTPLDRADPANDYLGMLIDLLKKTGVVFPGGKHLGVPTLRPVRGPYEWLHAESETDNPGDPRRVAVSFGPRHAPVTPVQVRDAIGETRGYDLVLFVGFACDPEARRMIDAGVVGRELHFANAAPDIMVNDPLRGEEHHLLKTTKATKLFTVFGAPDVRVHSENGGGLISVELVGVDLYDPNTGDTRHGLGSDVAAWFIDHDYDSRTFCICQALFPSGGTKNPWEKLQKALKGTIDEEKFEALRSTRSLPFKPGKKVAVTVIDDRGNEVIKLVDPKPSKAK